MKIKDKDIEKLIKDLEKEKEEIESSIRKGFISLKVSLKRSSWYCAITDLEDLIEDVTEIFVLEQIINKIKNMVE